MLVDKDKDNRGQEDRTHSKGCRQEVVGKGGKHPLPLEIRRQVDRYQGQTQCSRLCGASFTTTEESRTKKMKTKVFKKVTRTFRIQETNKVFFKGTKSLGIIFFRSHSRNQEQTKTKRDKTSRAVS